MWYMAHPCWRCLSLSRDATVKDLLTCSPVWSHPVLLSVLQPWCSMLVSASLSLSGSLDCFLSWKGVWLVIAYILWAATLKQSKFGSSMDSSLSALMSGSLRQSHGHVNALVYPYLGLFLAGFQMHMAEGDIKMQRRNVNSFFYKLMHLLRSIFLPKWTTTDESAWSRTYGHWTPASIFIAEILHPLMLC